MFNEQDKQLINEFEIGRLSNRVQIKLLKDFYETCDIRISMALEARLSDDQLTEFEALHDKQEDTLEDWLDHTIPNHQQIIASEINAVKQDVVQALAKAGYTNMHESTQSR